MNHSEKYIVFYDADCGVCQRSVNLLRQLDTQGLTIPLSLQKSITENQYQEITFSAALGQMHVITPDHKIIKGWVAVSTLATLFPKTKLLGIIGLLPIIRSIGQLFYICFANNRQKISKLLFGQACKFPS